MASNKRLKILCLHGYRQDSENFRSGLGPLRRSTKSIADYTFINAPLIVNGNETERGWWFPRSDCSEQSDVTLGLEDSLKLVSDTVEKEGPFDGILGFSQGASLAALVLQLGNKIHGDFDQVRFRFAILYCGFESRFSNHSIGGMIDLPTLHVVGLSDKVIPYERAAALEERFTKLTRLEHGGGHYIPGSGESKKEVINFVKKFADEAHA